MEQTPFPFHETAEDATSSAIIRSGKSYKEVAHALWPSMPIDSAYARLKNCLRPDAREKLLADEHIYIANHCREFDYLYYTAAKCHHSQPSPVEPDDELAALERAFIDSVGRLERLARRIDGARDRQASARPGRIKILRGEEEAAG